MKKTTSYSLNQWWPSSLTHVLPGLNELNLLWHYAGNTCWEFQESCCWGGPLLHRLWWAQKHRGRGTEHFLVPVSYTKTRMLSVWQQECHFDKILITGCTGSCHLTTSSAASDENVIKMMTFLFQYRMVKNIQGVQQSGKSQGTSKPRKSWGKSSNFAEGQWLALFRPCLSISQFYECRIGFFIVTVIQFWN